MSTNFHLAIRRFAVVCGFALAVVGITAFANSVSAQTAPTQTAGLGSLDDDFQRGVAALKIHDTSTPWTFNGLFDAYYLYDGNFPKGAGSGDVTGFSYDAKSSTPTLSLAELNISKAAPPTGGFGFKTTLLAGDTATQIAPGGQEARYQNIGQLYVTYALKSGAGIDVGKFYTPFGYEVVESNANYNYSRSFIFTDLLPVYHSGIRVYSPSYKGLVITGFVVKAINNVDLGGSDNEGVYDANKSFGYIGQLNYQSPSGKLDAVETYGGSHDGPNGNQDKTLLSDTDLTLIPDEVNTYGLNYTNREDTYDVGPGVQYNGYAAYYRRQVTTPYAVALRVEKIFTRLSGVSSNADSFTLTLENKVSKTLLVRLEGRHDDSSIAPFLTGTSGVHGKTQNTVSLSGVFTFGS